MNFWGWENTDYLRVFGLVLNTNRTKDRQEGENGLETLGFNRIVYVRLRPSP